MANQLQQSINPSIDIAQFTLPADSVILVGNSTIVNTPTMVGLLMNNYVQTYPNINVMCRAMGNGNTYAIEVTRPQPTTVLNNLGIVVAMGYGTPATGTQIQMGAAAPTARVHYPLPPPTVGP